MKYYIDFYDNTYTKTRKYILTMDKNIDENLLKYVISGIISGFNLGSGFGDDDPDYLRYADLSVGEKVNYLKEGLKKVFLDNSIDIYKENDEIFNLNIIL